VSCGVTSSLLSCGICPCNSIVFTRLVLQCFVVTDTTPVFVDETGKRLLMFSNNGKCEKEIVRFSGIPSDVSYTGENIVAVTIWDKHEVVFVNVITNSIINTVDIGQKHQQPVDYSFSKYKFAIR
jgi:hypothetical protein